MYIPTMADHAATTAGSAGTPFRDAGTVGRTLKMAKHGPSTQEEVNCCLKTNSNRYKTYKKTQAASSLSVANFSDFVLTITNDPNYQQQQQQQQPNQQQHQSQDVAAENAALRAELTGLRARMTATLQQHGHQDVAAVATAPGSSNSRHDRKDQCSLHPTSPWKRKRKRKPWERRQRRY